MGAISSYAKLVLVLPRQETELWAAAGPRYGREPWCQLKQQLLKPRFSGGGAAHGVRSVLSPWSEILERVRNRSNGESSRVASRLERATDVATLAAGLAAVVVAGVVVYRAFIDADPPPATPVGEITVTDWQRYADGGHRAGPETAPVTIIEFGDYQCPFCRAAETHLQAIRSRYGDEVALVYRHFPLPGHSSAFPAARAAECAGKQERFWEFHGLLYATESWIGDTSRARLAELAERAGVDRVDEFLRCLDGSEGDDAVDADIAAARSLGITGTPTFLVNGQLHVGPLDSLRFFAVFDELREDRPE